MAPAPSQGSRERRSLLLALGPPLCGSGSTHGLLLALLLRCRRLLYCRRLLARGRRRRHSIEDRGLAPRLQQRAAVAGGSSGEEELLPAQPGQQAAALLWPRKGEGGVTAGAGVLALRLRPAERGWLEGRVWGWLAQERAAKGCDWDRRGPQILAAAGPEGVHPTHF